MKKEVARVAPFSEATLTAKTEDLIKPMEVLMFPKHNLRAKPVVSKGVASRLSRGARDTSQGFFQ